LSITSLVPTTTVVFLLPIFTSLVLPIVFTRQPAPTSQPIWTHQIPMILMPPCYLLSNMVTL
jgi:hypothetical protein